MPYTLKTEEIEICGETLTVSQASNAMDIERSLLITEAEKEGQEEKGTEGNYVYYVRTLLYPSLIACTTGNLPTVEEFMNNIPTLDSTKWIDVARKLNPQWFRYVSALEEDVEKKE